MATKQKLLQLLEAAEGGVVSGEQIASALGVSRAAVWKAIRALQGEGLLVESTPGSGYRLLPGSDLLSEEALLALLPQGAAGGAISSGQIQVLEETESTNLEAKRWAVEGAPHGSLVMAARQQSGRGRLGRGFVSPPGGVYMSVILRPQMEPGEPVLITAAAAVAVCRAVKRLCGLDLGIKWVNDLFYGGRKCCGILAEAGFGLENGRMEYIVVGIGVNLAVRKKDFPGGLQSIATSLYPDGKAPVSRARLAVAIYEELLGLAANLGGRAFLPEYRRRSVVLGREVTVCGQPPYTATALDIDDDARLVVQKADGERLALSSSEISVRLGAGPGAAAAGQTPATNHTGGK